MRYGISWPAGHGRREWVSFGWFGTAVYGLLALAWLAVVIVAWVLWLLLYRLPAAVARAVRPSRSVAG